MVKVVDNFHGSIKVSQKRGTFYGHADTVLSMLQILSLYSSHALSLFYYAKIN